MCSGCWGSGDENRHGVDLSKIEEDMKKQAHEYARIRFAGAQSSALWVSILKTYTVRLDVRNMTVGRWLTLRDAIRADDASPVSFRALEIDGWARCSVFASNLENATEIMARFIEEYNILAVSWCC